MFTSVWTRHSVCVGHTQCLCVGHTQSRVAGGRGSRATPTPHWGFPVPPHTSKIAIPQLRGEHWITMDYNGIPKASLGAPGAPGTLGMGPQGGPRAPLGAHCNPIVIFFTMVVVAVGLALSLGEAGVGCLRTALHLPTLPAAGCHNGMPTKDALVFSVSRSH